MRYRQLGASGLRVSALTMGTMTFGGTGGFASVGSTDLDGARRQVDRCLEAGVNLIDTADVYSDGLSEEILGQVLQGRRDDLLVAPRRACPWATAPTTPACPATTCSAPARPACGGCAPTASTCTRSTSGTGRPRRRRRSRPWTTWSAPARSATSAAPTTPAGSS
jgi:hypothetical protein